MLEQNLLISLIVGVFVGAAAGYLGSFMVLRKMALVGDAMTHVALPGIGLALILNINPFIGAFTFLVVATFGIWRIENKTNLSVESVVGVFFTASLALGIIITPEIELLEVLFGNISNVARLDAILAVVFSIFALWLTFNIKKDLLLGIMSPDLAKASRINVDRINLVFLLLVSLVVALGVKVVGTLLMGSLVIVPAAAARNISDNFTAFGTWSLIFGVVSVGLGVYLTKFFTIPSGPLVVLVSVAIFLVTLVFRKA